MQEEIFEGRDTGGFYISDGCSASQYLLFITCVRLGWVRKLDLNKVRLSNQCKRRDLKAEIQKDSTFLKAVLLLYPYSLPSF